MPASRPDDVVIIDNLGSPDFKIGNAFAKLRALLRKTPARSRDLPSQALAEAIKK